MKTGRTILFLLSILTMTAGAAVSLQIDGTAYESIALKTGQAVTVEIASDDASAYNVYAGFATSGAALGTFTHLATLPAAGNLASVTAVAPPPVWGFYAGAGGASPAPSAGVHFQFTYTPNTVGTTTLYLYASDATTLLDSIAITVEPAALGSAFTYQGRLIDDNQAPNGAYDFEFKLYDAPTEGSQLGSTNADDDVDVIDGYFTSELDFGLSPYNGNSVWLQVGVRPNASMDPYTALNPRQRLTSTPNANFASISDWNNLLNIPAGFADGTDNVLPESQVEGYIANDVTANSIPYSTGSALAGTDLYYSSLSQCLGFGTSSSSLTKMGISTSTAQDAVNISNSRSSGSRWGIYVSNTGNTTGDSYGIRSSSSSATGENYGVYGIATTASTGTNYGIYGSASNSTGDAYAGYFSGNTRIAGKLNHNYDLQIATDDGVEVAIGTSIDSYSKLKVYTTTDTYAIYGNAAGTTSSNYGVRGYASGDTSYTSYGVSGISSSETGSNYGVYGSASTSSTGNNYGVYGNASNSGSGSAYAGYFQGDVNITGYLNRSSDLYIALGDDAEIGIGANPISTKKVYVYTDSDSVAVHGHAANPSSNNYGLYGQASANSTGNNYGIYAYAANGGTGSAYAGYFSGNVYVTSNVSAASFTDRTPYPQDLQTAVDAVMSMSPLSAGQYQEGNKEMQLDHSTLSPFIRSEDGKRDLSATVSCHNEVLKDILSKQEQLENASLMIEQMKGTIMSQQEQIIQLQEQVKKMELLEQKMDRLLSAQ
jgi:hypothetical protein